MAADLLGGFGVCRAAAVNEWREVARETFKHKSERTVARVGKEYTRSSHLPGGLRQQAFIDEHEANVTWMAYDTFCVIAELYRVCIHKNQDSECILRVISPKGRSWQVCCLQYYVLVQATTVVVHYISQQLA